MSAHLIDFIGGLFKLALSKIFGLFKIEARYTSCIDVFTDLLCASLSFLGCVTRVINFILIILRRFLESIGFQWGSSHE